MELDNQMQHRILGAFRFAARQAQLDWVQTLSGANEGVGRVQPPGRFHTVLKLEFEFRCQTCRLLIYRQDRLIGGRCGIPYDDGEMIERTLDVFRELLAEAAVVQPAPSRAGQSDTRADGRCACWSDHNGDGAPACAEFEVG